MEDHMVKQVWKQKSIYQMRMIASGSYGDVYEAYDQVNNRIIALKHVKDEYWEEEVEMLRKMKHETIVRYYDHFSAQQIDGDRNSRGAYILMEFVDGRTLREILAQRSVCNDGLPEEVVLSIFTQLVEGFSYIHKMQIVHRDIKPENIIIYDEQHAKIIDLGISKMRKLLQTSNRGTPLYNPPQVYNSQNPKDFRRDVWSLGMVLYEMLTGRCLYSRFLSQYKHDFSLQKKLKDYVIKGRLKINLKKSLDPFWSQLLELMLEKDYKKRKYMHQIKLLLQNNRESIVRRIKRKLEWKNIQEAPLFHVKNLLLTTKNPLLATTKYTQLSTCKKYLKFYHQKHKFLIILVQLLSLRKFPCRYPFLPKIHKIILMFLCCEIYLTSVDKIMRDLKNNVIKVSPEEKFKLYFFDEPYKTQIQKQITSYLHFYEEQRRIFSDQLTEKIIPAFRQSFEDFSKPIKLYCEEQKTILKTKKKSQNKSSSTSHMMETIEKIEESSKGLQQNQYLDHSNFFKKFQHITEILKNYQNRTRLQREQYLDLFKELVDSQYYVCSYCDMKQFFYTGDLAIHYLMKVIACFDSFYSWSQAKNGGYQMQKDLDDIESMQKNGMRQNFMEKIKMFVF